MYQYRYHCHCHCYCHLKCLRHALSLATGYWLLATGYEYMGITYTARVASLPHFPTRVRLSNTVVQVVPFASRACLSGTSKFYAELVCSCITVLTSEPSNADLDPRFFDDVQNLGSLRDIRIRRGG